MSAIRPAHSAYWLHDQYFWAAITAAEDHGFAELLGDFLLDGPAWFGTWMAGGEL